MCSALTIIDADELVTWEICSLTVSVPIPGSGTTVFGTGALTGVPDTTRFRTVVSPLVAKPAPPLVAAAVAVTASAVTTPPPRFTAVAFDSAVVLFAVVVTSSLIAPTVPAPGRTTLAAEFVWSSPACVVQPSVASAVGPDDTTPPRSISLP